MIDVISPGLLVGRTWKGIFVFVGAGFLRRVISDRAVVLLGDALIAQLKVTLLTNVQQRHSPPERHYRTNLPPRDICVRGVVRDGPPPTSCWSCRSVQVGKIPQLVSLRSHLYAAGRRVLETRIRRGAVTKVGIDPFRRGDQNPGGD